ncbi:MAG: tetratricopeptide repeat protein [Bacteroidota bacterium]
MKNHWINKNNIPNSKGKPQIKEKTGWGRLINIVISVFILIPVFYLMYFLKYEKAGATGAVKDNLAVNKNTDSLQLKLQSAIDLASSYPGESNYIALSLEYYNNGKYKECADAALKALQYNPKSYAAYNNMCCSYNMLGYWDEAIEAGKKALEMKPGDQLATNNLKASVDGKAAQDKKISDAESLVKTNPDELNYLNLGNIYYGARKYELAITAFQMTLACNNKNAVAYNNICSAYNELGKWKEAAENCKKALEIDSSFSLAKNNLNVANEELKK